MMSIIGTLAVLILTAIFTVGLYSQRVQPAVGLVHGHLRPCPDTPNCVCSEHLQDSIRAHHISPVSIKGQDTGRAWQSVKQAIEDSGGRLVEVRDDYLHAEFISPVFHFVDDVEARLDSHNNIIHLRSASRVGHSDLGVNSKRIEHIHTLIKESL